MARRQYGAPLNTLPQLTDAPMKLSNAPSKIQDDVMLIIEIFVILLYDKASHMHRYKQISANIIYIENQYESHSYNWNSM